MVTMIICNEAVAVGIEKLPMTVETALQDLKDYHADTTSQLRKCLTRSLDVASEAILADLDSERNFLSSSVKTLDAKSSFGQKGRITALHFITLNEDNVQNAAFSMVVTMDTMPEVLTECFFPVGVLHEHIPVTNCILS